MLDSLKTSFTLYNALFVVIFIFRGSKVDAVSCNISTAELSALESLYYSADGDDWACRKDEDMTISDRSSNIEKNSNYSLKQPST
jgi:hypothetical protein